MTNQVLWVVEQGEYFEGGSVKAITQHRTEARIIKRDICRGEYFFHGVDYVTIKKIRVHNPFIHIEGDFPI